MDEEIKKLAEKNLQLTEEIHAMVKKIKSYLAFQRLVSIFYLIMIIGPIIFGIIYLSPLLNSLIGQYKDILGTQSIDIDSIENLIKGASSNLKLE